MKSVTPLLVVDRLSVSYGTSRALEDVSFQLEEGQALAVVGANGAGKSSLARGLSGLVVPASGSVQFAGRNVTGWPSHRIRSLGMIQMPEGRGVAPTLSVQDNLRMGVRSLRSKSQRQSSIEEIFDLFPILADRRRQLAGTLSGGEQQMLALARAVSGRPRLLIADEVSLGLAPLVVDAVFDHLEAVRNNGVTIILIEQFVHRALEFSDAVIILRRGSLVLVSPSDAISHEEILNRYIGERSTA